MVSISYECEGSGSDGAGLAQVLLVLVLLLLLLVLAVLVPAGGHPLGHHGLRVLGGAAAVLAGGLILLVVEEVVVVLLLRHGRPGPIGVRLRADSSDSWTMASLVDWLWVGASARRRVVI
jgi:hypothetical protein